MRKLSQAALAKASGLSQGAISSYENRTRKTTTGIFELAQALEVNPFWLHTGRGSMLASPGTGTRQSAGLKDYRADNWPFVDVTPEDYWSLDPQQRQIVEQTVRSLISALSRPESGKQN